MKTFLGIGVSHEGEAFDFVYDVLSNYSPQAVSLEKRMIFANIGESCIHDRERKEKLYAKKSKIKYERTNGRVIIRTLDSRPCIIYSNVQQVRLYLDELCVLDGQSLEFNPVLAYALDYNVPFYFVDIPIYCTKDIIEFRQDDYQVISLEDEVKLTESLSLRELSFLAYEDNRIRNKFAADAINYFFRKGLSCIAHIGGTGHFNVQYFWSDKWEPYDETYQAHIQDFVKADKIIIADSNTKKVHQLK